MAMVMMPLGRLATRTPQSGAICSTIPALRVLFLQSAARKWPKGGWQIAKQKA